MSKICGIYKITSPTGKIYIGQSVDIERRWRYHKRLLPHYHINILYRSLMKHGVDSHTFEIIEECESAELNKLERYYIKKYDTFETDHGMNLTDGGGSQVVFSKSTREKRSNANRGNTNWLGRHHSEETKELLSQILIGNKRRLGTHLSEETKEKLRIVNTGRKNSEETRRKISEGNIGKRKPNKKKRSEEYNAERAKKQTGEKNNVKRTSKYFGVSLYKSGSYERWLAVITINKKQNRIGVFKTEIEAARAYDRYVIEHVPYEIQLNFEEYRSLLVELVELKKSM